jgi:hypothetical protein
MNAMKRRLSGMTGLLLAVGWIAACSSSNGTHVAEAGTDPTGSSDSSTEASEPSNEGGPDTGPNGDGSSTDGDSGEPGEGRADSGIDGASEGSPSDNDAMDAMAPGLDGASVTLVAYYPTLSTPISQQLTATVGPTVEFPDIENDALPGYELAEANVDVGPSSIDIEYHQSPSIVAPSAAFNGFVFSFSPTTSPAIQGASLDASSTYNASQVIITFSPHTVSVNGEGVAITDTSRILIDLTF